jgi:hypothetical protein
MSSEASERWFKLAQQFPIGPKRGGLVPSAQPSEGVEPGQVRQAYWHETSAIVVIVDVDDAYAQCQVLPATLEPGVEDHRAIVVEAETSPLYGPITVWPDAAAIVPFAVLDTTIASIPFSLLEMISDATPADRTAAGLRRGHSNPPLGSGAAMAIDELFDAIDVLQHAPGLQPSVVGKPAVALQIPLSSIMDALQIPQPRAMAIRMGKEPLTPEEAEQLALAANLSVDEVLANVAPLPIELQRELQEPRWRKHIRRRATDGDENSARARLGYEAYQLAARETGQGRERWRQRLEAVLAMENG